jgi:hypothetical protein
MRGAPFEPGLVGRELYLCCNLGFNTSFEAADSNYGLYMLGRRVYGAGPALAAGTNVTVTSVGSSGVAFRPESNPQVYTLYFNYGRKQLAPTEYFHRILRDTNPMEEIGDAPERIVEGINDGKLLEGMTKDQALVTRGYPPAHQTPDLGADQWIYYETPGFVERVTFVDGKIASVEKGPAPE